MLTIELTKDEVLRLIEELKNSKDKNIEISLLEKKVFFKDKTFSFDLDEFHRTCLLEGLDNIALTLKHEAQIKAYEKNSKSLILNFVETLIYPIIKILFSPMKKF